MRIKDQNVFNAWELNERHYGALTGLNKDEMKKHYGEEKIHTFRRSQDNPPKPLKKTSPYHPLNIDIYKNVPKDKIPDTESLKNTYERVIPFYNENISSLEIPTGNPLLIISEKGKIKNARYLDKDRAKDLLVF